MPFPGGIAETANGTLIFAMLAAVTYGFMTDRPPSLRRTLAKMLSVALLAVLAALRDGPVLLVAALALSAVGDACLAQRGERWFLGGLASFLAAHLAYVALFWAQGGGLPIVALGGIWRVGAGVAMVVAVAIMLWRLWRGVPGDLRAPVAAYALAILAMGLAALTVPAPLVIGGALLFMASDGLLAAGKFLVPETSPHRAWMQPSVWALYFAAQLAIVLGFLL